MPLVKLGKTGIKISRLGHGGSWDIDQEVLSVGFQEGINFIDTAESYRGGQSERSIGEFLKARGAVGHSAERKKICLISKTHQADRLEAQLPGILKRLGQSYLDVYYMHQIDDPKLATSPEIRAAAARMKQSGGIRFFGFSCHDAPVVECLNAAADSDFIDVVMFRYDYHYYQTEGLNRAIDRCFQKGVGLIAMKTQVGGMTLPERFNPFKKRGLNQHQAAIKAVAADSRIASICSEMTAVQHVRENAEAVRSPLTLAEAEAIGEHAQQVSHLWCRGCDHLCRAAAGPGASVAVADSLRFLMYHDHYRKPEHARALFAALPRAERDLSAIESGAWAAAEAACPHGLPLTRLMTRVRERLG